MKPLVAITTHHALVDEGSSATRHEVVAAPYVKAVAKAGGIPVAMPVVDPSDTGSIDALLDRFDAVVITGGPDVDPSRYGRATEPGCQATNPERDASDLAVATACVARNQPTLAICRGVQVLNVAIGGTLIQHIDDHMVTDRYNQCVHDLRVDERSLLASVIGSAYWSNSLHHQALDGLGDGARAVAWAPDNTIEAIELEQAPAVLGVQWHPELLRHDAGHLALFQRLLALAEDRRRAHRLGAGHGNTLPPVRWIRVKAAEVLGRARDGDRPRQALHGDDEDIDG
jgi:putative glutamine amidotransferase